MTIEEREFSRGPLGKHTFYRLLTIGPMGVKELNYLIRKFELDRDILLAEESKAQSNE